MAAVLEPPRASLIRPLGTAPSDTVGRDAELKPTQPPSASWFSWRPTSAALLEYAEQQVLSVVKAAYRQEKVMISETEHINTLVVNEADTHKPPLVLVHGFAGGVGIWCKNLDELAAEYRVYCFDTLGFGRSARPKFPKSAEACEARLVDAIEQWRLQMGLDRIHLLGHSFGAFQACLYALKHPEAVEHLILADPWGVPARPPPEERRQLPLWARALVGVVGALGSPITLLRATGPLGPSLLRKARGDLGSKFSEVHDGSTILAYFYHCNAQTPSAELAFSKMSVPIGWAKNPLIERVGDLHPDMPLSLLYGDQTWMDSSMAETISDLRADAAAVRTFTIDDAGHHIYADNHAQFNEVLLRLRKEFGGAREASL